MVESKWIELADEHDQLKEDFMTLMGRLWLESPGTMSPEVREVMGRYAYEFEDWAGRKGIKIDPMRWISFNELKTTTQEEVEEVFRRG